MISVQLSYIASTLGWRLVGDDRMIESVCTDSRSVKIGDCFIALYGDNFDAHDFIKQVVEQGASSIIVSKEQDNSYVPQLVVKDTRLALAQLAGLIKSLASVKTIAITGSCGKTTVKEMLSKILSQRGNVLATKGNFNNDIGAPLTLLRLTKNHQYAVIELGANHVGEIDFTSEITQPDVAIITNIGAAHLEGFGGINGVVTAKSEIFNHLSSTGYAIFDGDSEYAARWKAQNSDKHVMCFSDKDITTDQMSGDTSKYVWASTISMNDTGHCNFELNTAAETVVITLPIPGEHNVKNALAAGSAALAVGLSLTDVKQGLESMFEVKGRLNVNIISDKLSVIDDTYNANASSITAAIKVLGNCEGKKVLILGDMAELGEYALASHQSLGPVIEQHHIDALLTFGTLSIHYGHGFTGLHQHFNEKSTLNEYTEQQIMNFTATQKTTVLVKGSRSATMESVVEFIQNNKKIGAPTQC
jgi:UDP-N-acetylmuramoyl-tripeptide--D-alanyl-D-alanine ligase